MLNDLGGKAPYQLTIEASYPGSNVKDSTNNITVKYTTDIYYDAPYEQPSIKTALTAFDNISSVTPNPTQLCGIYVFESINSFTIKSSITVSDIGNYYYNGGDNGIIKYSVTSPSNIFEDSKETNIVNVKPGSITSNKFNKDVVFENNNLEFKFKNGNFSYFQEISIKPTVYNAIGETNEAKEEDLLKLKIICDKNNSIKDVQTVTNGGNFSNGFRIKTNNLANFDNTESLVSSNELLYANGMYVTPGIDSPEKYYINYSEFYSGGTSNINPNYSSSAIINSTRYVTFKWSIVSPNCTQIIFNFENVNKTIPSNFEFDYKIEDSYHPGIGLTKIGSDSDTGADKYNAYGGTNWILGSSSSYTSVTPSNYIDNSIYSGYLSFNLNSYTVSLPSYNTDFTDNIPSNVYFIYCRIKIPLNPTQGFSFSGVSAKVSA